MTMCAKISDILNRALFWRKFSLNPCTHSALVPERVSVRNLILELKDQIDGHILVPFNQYVMLIHFNE